MKQDKYYVNCNIYRDQIGGNYIGRIFSISKLPKNLVCPEENIDIFKLEEGKLLNISIPTIME